MVSHPQYEFPSNGAVNAYSKVLNRRGVLMVGGGGLEIFQKK